MKKWSKEETDLAIEMFDLGNSKRDIADKLEKTDKAVRLHLNRLGLYFKNPNLVKKVGIECAYCRKQFIASITENRKFCNKSCSASFNNSESPKRVKSLKNVKAIIIGKTFHCVDCKTEISKLSERCMQCDANYKTSKRDEIVVSGNGKPVACKTYLLKSRGHQCEQCLNKEWNGLPIPLELDHTDENSENNDLNNLKLLCCNCHAQTSTYKGKNKGNGRHFRRIRYAEGKSF